MPLEFLNYPNLISTGYNIIINQWLLKNSKTE